MADKAVDLMAPTLVRTRDFLTKITELQASDVLLIAKTPNKDFIVVNEGPEGILSAAQLLAVASAIVSSSIANGGTRGI